MFGYAGSLVCLLATFLALGFAYIVWVLSVKEQAAARLCGQIIAVIIAILIVLLFLNCAIYGKGMHCGMMGGKAGDHKMMMQGKECGKHMEKGVMPHKR